jgi:hypothetical protein
MSTWSSYDERTQRPLRTGAPEIARPRSDGVEDHLLEICKVIDAPVREAKPHRVALGECRDEDTLKVIHREAPHIDRVRSCVKVFPGLPVPSRYFAGLVLQAAPEPAFEILGHHANHKRKLLP